MLREEDMELSLKVIIVGNGMVGKSSLIAKFARGTTVENYKKTIGTDFMEKEITTSQTGERVKLLLWDTAGQEMFSTLTRAYYRGAGAVIYVFSTIDRDSFMEIERWKAKVEEECGPNIAAVLVQNKIDLVAQQAMTPAEVEDLARRINIRLYRTCVLENQMVPEVFDYVAEQFIKQGGEAALDAPAVPAIGELGGAAGRAGDAGAGAHDPMAASMRDAPAPTSQAFKLEPLTRRTGGKKATRCCT